MSEAALHSKKPWRAVLARRRWRAGYNAGGAPEHAATTAMNPQFHIQIPRSSSASASSGTAAGSGGGGSVAKCHVVVSVTQQYETNPLHSVTGSGSGSGDVAGGAVGSGRRRKKKKRKLHHIGFAVYEVPPHMTRLTPGYVAEHVRQWRLLCRNNVDNCMVAFEIKQR